MNARRRVSIACGAWLLSMCAPGAVWGWWLPFGTTPATPPADPMYVVSMSAASSRGAYQAGVLSAVLAHFGHNRRFPANVVEPRGAPGVFSGVSVGGLNAVVAATAWCARDTDAGTVDDNALWQTWRDFDWSELFPSDLTCGEYADAHPDLGVECTDRDATPYAPGEAVITVSGTNAIRRQIFRRLMTPGTAREDCRVAVTLPIDSEEPVGLALGTQTITSSRRLVSVELRTVADPCPDGESCRPTYSYAVCAIPPDPKATTAYLELPRASNAPVLPDAEDCQRISVNALLEVVSASSALPPLVAPQTVHYCGRGCSSDDEPGFWCPAGLQLCASRFNDAAFDQVPVTSEAARWLRTVWPSASVRHVLAGAAFNPFHKTHTPPPFRGVRHYFRQIENFIDVGRGYELQLLGRYGQLPDPMTTVARDLALPLVADLAIFEGIPLLPTVATGVAGFFDVHYRRHDYAVGVVDGLKWLAREATCHNNGLGACVGKEVQERLAFDVVQRSTDALNSGAVRALLGNGSEVGSDDRAAVKKVHKALDDLEGVRRFDKFAEKIQARGLYPKKHVPDFVGDYRAWRMRTAEQMMARLELVERKQGNDGAGTALAVAQYLTAIDLSRSSSGLSFGPTTVPRRMWSSGGAATLTKLLVPSTLTGNTLHGGTAWGWEPFGYDWRYARLTFANFAVQYAKDLAPRGEAWGLALAPVALTLLPRVWYWMDTGVRPQVWWNPEGRSGGAQDVSFGGEIFLRPFYGRLEISFGTRDLLCRGNRGGTGLSCEDARFINVGVADLSGLFYWVVRALGGDKTYEDAGSKLIDVPSQLVGAH